MLLQGAERNFEMNEIGYNEFFFMYMGIEYHQILIWSTNGFG
jgi:hypothetical protein